MHGTTVGEVAVGCMLSLARLLHVYRDHQNATEWYTAEYERPFTVENKHLCVLGLGTIRSGIATRADALGMEVVGVRRSDESVPGISTIYNPDKLHKAISKARLVATTLSHTPRNRWIALLRGVRGDARGRLLINAARSPIVDEDALVAALENGEIAGAALNVFETEPLPAKSSLWDFEEIIVAPQGIGHESVSHRDRRARTENVERFRSGEELTNRVA